jgi:hypothetical protein
MPAPILHPIPRLAHASATPQPSPIDRYRAAILAAEEDASERFTLGDEDEALISDDLATAEEAAYALFEGASLEMERLSNATPTAAQTDALMNGASASFAKLRPVR